MISLPLNCIQPIFPYNVSETVWVSATIISGLYSTTMGSALGISYLGHKSYQWYVRNFITTPPSEDRKPLLSYNEQQVHRVLENRDSAEPFAQNLTHHNSYKFEANQENEWHYEGKSINGLPHGKGKLTGPDGLHWEGTFSDGYLLKGRLTFLSGLYFKGSFSKNVLQEGKQVFPNGTCFKGHFVDDKLRKGEKKFPNGYRLKGTFNKEGWLEEGKESFPDGTYYKGFFFEGKLREGERIFSHGACHKGHFVEDELRKGEVISKNGYRWEGTFLNNKLFGKGKLTKPNGISYEGTFSNDQLISDISNLGDLAFSALVFDHQNDGEASSYPLGILSDYLQKKGYFKAANALKQAHLLSLIDGPDQIREEAKKIHLILTDKRHSYLLPYGYKRHAMGLNLVPHLSSEWIDCEIFNSGRGLVPYHKQHKTDSDKFQMMLILKVPIENLTLDVIKMLLNSDTFENADKAYQVIQNLGAIVVEPDQPIWQTPQKSPNCSLRWIIDFLENKSQEFGEFDFEEMFSQFKADCWDAYEKQRALRYL